MLSRAGLSELFAKPPELYTATAEIVNDLHGPLITFWRVLACPKMFAEFQQRVFASPFSREGFKAATEVLNQHADKPIDRSKWVDVAAAFFIASRQSHQGERRQFALITKGRLRRQMNEQISAWLGSVELLPEFHNRVSRLLIENMDAVKLIQKLDDKETFFFCDPPWLGAKGSLYVNKMTLEQHNELLTVLGSIKGKFMLCGYDHASYQKAKERYGWRELQFTPPSSMSSKKQKDRLAVSVWVNYPPETELQAAKKTNVSESASPEKPVKKKSKVK